MTHGFPAERAGRAGGVPGTVGGPVRSSAPTFSHNPNPYQGGIMPRIRRLVAGAVAGITVGMASIAGIASAVDPGPPSDPVEAAKEVALLALYDDRNVDTVDVLSIECTLDGEVLDVLAREDGALALCYALGFNRHGDPVVFVVSVSEDPVITEWR